MTYLLCRMLISSKPSTHSPHDPVAADCPKVKHCDLESAPTHLRVLECRTRGTAGRPLQAGTRVDDGPDLDRVQVIDEEDEDIPVGGEDGRA